MLLHVHCYKINKASGEATFLMYSLRNMLCLHSPLPPRIQSFVLFLAQSPPPSKKTATVNRPLVTTVIFNKIYLAHIKVYLLKHIFVLQVILPGGANLLFLLIEKKKKKIESKSMSSRNELSLYSHSSFTASTTASNLDSGFCSHSAWIFAFPGYLYVTQVNTSENFRSIY